MTTIAQVAELLAGLAPLTLAESWDNVGLLVGDGAGAVNRVMTCLTITPASAEEAIQEQAELIVTHHPLPFRPLQRLTTETTPGRLLWRLMKAGVSIYSLHTAFDSAGEGINAQLAAGLGLGQIAPLKAAAENAAIGSGRFGRLDPPVDLETLAGKVKSLLRLESLQLVGPPSQPIASVAVACGSGGDFLGSAAAAGCDCLITGETNFHTCLEAEARGVALVLTGHYASERSGVESLARMLAERLPNLTVWASRRETDPLRWFSG